MQEKSIDELIKNLKKTCWGETVSSVNYERLEAAEALSTLQTELNAMRGAANSYKIDNVKLQADLDKAKADTAPHWISVADALPPLHVDVLVCEIRRGHQTINMSWRDYQGNWTPASGHITHWMPLPEPPKEVPSDD